MATRKNNAAAVVTLDDLFAVKVSTYLPAALPAAAFKATDKGAARDAAQVTTMQAVQGDARTLVAMMFAEGGLVQDFTARAVAYLNGANDDAALTARRDMFNIAYRAEYLARALANKKPADKDAAANASKQAWMRLVARATKAGYVKPEKELSAEAKRAKAAREAKKAKEPQKKDGRTARAEAKRVEKVKASVIVGEDVGEEVQAAIDWVLDDAAHTQWFLAWVKSRQTVETTTRIVKAK
jgi:hypothetical protein